MGQQYLITNASDALGIMLMMLSLMAGGIIMLASGIRDDNRQEQTEGFGITYAGLAGAIAIWGVHVTPRASSADWVWIGLLLTAGVIAIACCYRPHPVARLRLAVATCQRRRRYRGRVRYRRAYR